MSTMELTFLWVAALAAGFLAYTYIGYPVFLWLLGLITRRTVGSPEEEGTATGQGHVPLVSVVIAAHNEAGQIDDLIRSLLALDYPSHRLQILIVSDGSDDGTDERVQAYASQGVELLRVETRGGKTAAETAAVPHIRGEIVLNTDASVRMRSGALKNLVAAFQDPEVGLASGRDISVGKAGETANQGEAGYVGYEMAVRDLETRVYGIVGASGSLYAIRKELHGDPLPAFLSRDFAASMITRERGYRSVSVPEAVCIVPRTSSLRREFARKVRTIARGMDTLAFKRHLLNPIRYPLLSWMLVSHKICRWLAPWAAAILLVCLGFLTPGYPLSWAPFLGGLAILALGGLAWMYSERNELPAFLAIPGYLVVGNVAAMQGLLQFLRGDREAVWEPTRREAVVIEPTE